MSVDWTEGRGGVGDKNKEAPRMVIDFTTKSKQSPICHITNSRTWDLGLRDLSEDRDK